MSVGYCIWNSRHCKFLVARRNSRKGARQQEDNSFCNTPDYPLRGKLGRTHLILILISSILALKNSTQPSNPERSAPRPLIHIQLLDGIHSLEFEKDHLQS
ncbi:hypothetical protein Droror1_Dr00001018 [Drosera rotundifolia]